MRLLAPTVAVSQAPISEVLAALRSAGFAPAAEDSSGTIVDIRARGARVPAPRDAASTARDTEPRPPDAGRDRRGAAQGGRRRSANMRLDPAVAITQLQEAALTRRRW